MRNAKCGRTIGHTDGRAWNALFRITVHIGLLINEVFHIYRKKDAHLHLNVAVILGSIKNIVRKFREKLLPSLL